MLLLTITNTTWIIIAAAALVVGLAVGYFITSTLLKKAVTKEEQALLEEAKEKAEVIKKERILQAKEKFLQMKDEHEKACEERNRAAQKVEQKANQLKQDASQKMDEAQRKAKEVQAAQQKLESQQQELDDLKVSVENDYVPVAIIEEGIRDYAEETDAEQGHDIFIILNLLLAGNIPWAKCTRRLKAFFKKAMKEFNEMKRMQNITNQFGNGSSANVFNDKVEGKFDNGRTEE